VWLVQQERCSTSIVNRDMHLLASASKPTAWPGIWHMFRARLSSGNAKSRWLQVQRAVRSAKLFCKVSSFESVSQATPGPRAAAQWSRLTQDGSQRVVILGGRGGLVETWQCTTVQARDRVACLPQIKL